MEKPCSFLLGEENSLDASEGCRKQQRIHGGFNPDAMQQTLLNDLERTGQAHTDLSHHSYRYKRWREMDWQKKERRRPAPLKKELDVVAFERFASHRLPPSPS